jgi:hypothetical protein
MEDTVSESESFLAKLGKAKKNSGMRRDGYATWCSSVVKGEDGKYHMFASTWPYNTRLAYWTTHSEIIRCVSDTPEGPFKYQAQALPPRGEGYWDASMTHNPTIHKHGDTYILFYTGTKFIDTDDLKGNRLQAWNNKRIGIAVSKSVYGPWTRFDQPILRPRAGKWDSIITSNAAPCVREDGSVLLVYKSASRGEFERKDNDILDLKLGVAYANNYLGPYERIREDWIFSEFGYEFDTEDAYVWWQDGKYHMLAKLFEHGEQLLGEAFAGYYATSPDGINWKMHDPPKGYTRTVTWEDGSTTTFERAERVQLLIENGKPTHMYLACAELLKDKELTISRSICIPLKD